MSTAKRKLLLVIIALLYSVIVPIMIVSLFFLLFPEFYTKGFLTGLGHMLICGIMILLNIFLIPIISLNYYKKFIIELTTDGKAQFTNRILILLSISVVTQVVLSILIENPFKDPPSNFF
jgi:hypothetical protein